MSKLIYSLIFVLLSVSLVSGHEKVEESRAVQKRQGGGIVSAFSNIPVMIWEFIEYGVRGIFVTLFGVEPRYGGSGGSGSQDQAKGGDNKSKSGQKGDGKPPSIANAIGSILVKFWNFGDNFVRAFLRVTLGAKFTGDKK